MSYRKEYGLPRRFAPRNDMQKVGRCARVQGRNDMQKLAGCLRVQERAAMANPQPLLYSPKVLLLVLPHCKENGLPRRFAPRNDMQKVGRCARVQGRNDMQ